MCRLPLTVIAVGNIALIKGVYINIFITIGRHCNAKVEKRWPEEATASNNVPAFVRRNIL
jgi:hypothetical protein